MILTSPSFQHNEPMPLKFSCQGEGISPELIISEIPASTRSLTLICDDPDAPNGGFTHWIMVNIPPTTKTIPENSSAGQVLPNTRGNLEFAPACPPSGNHHYIFKLFALNATLNITQDISRADLDKEISQHLIEKTELIGMYQKNTHS